MALGGSITLNEITIAEVTADPSVSGIDLPIGSFALLNDGMGGKAWIKFGALGTDWAEVSTGSNLPIHAFTHLPNGTDPLTTAAAVTLSATTTNATGNANSFARSNHTHSITTGTPSTQTPDQTNSTGTGAALARADHTHNIPTAAAITISTDSTNTQGNAASFARSNHTHKVELARYNVRATNEAQTTSGSDVLLTDMIITPVAGTYLVFAYTSNNNTTNGAINRFSVYSAGVEVADTKDNIQVSNNRIHTWGASCEVTVNGSQAIEIRWNRSSGTARCFGRYITLIRVA